MSKVLELKEKIKVAKFPDDIIKAITMLMNTSHFSKNPGKIHGTIYKLKHQNEEYRELLEDFVFDLSGIEPYSELLDRVIFRLETSGVLGTKNPKYEEYRVEKTENIEEEINNKFTGNEKEVLKKISRDFENLVKE